MTAPTAARASTEYAHPVSAERLERAAAALTTHGFAAEILDDAGGARRAIWVVGSQKVVPDLDAALRRVEDHCLPLEGLGVAG
jgi:hypothetical protein